MKIVVITGASSGIGAALARTLGARGCQLALGARRMEMLERVAAESKTRAITIVTDVRRRKDLERLRDEALKEFGHIDVWVNNAGRGIGRSVADLTDEEFDEMMLVNVKSALYGMQAILPHFRERGEGHIINISSFLARVPFATYRSAYSAAKSALNILSSNLRMDLRKPFPNIHVSVVMPGVVLTDFHDSALHGTPPPEQGRRSTPTQTPEEVAGAIAGLIDEPRAELYTNPALAQVAERYYHDVGEFESGMG